MLVREPSSNGQKNLGGTHSPEFVELDFPTRESVPIVGKKALDQLAFTVRRVGAAAGHFLFCLPVKWRRRAASDRNPSKRREFPVRRKNTASHQFLETAAWKSFRCRCCRTTFALHSAVLFNQHESFGAISCSALRLPLPNGPCLPGLLLFWAATFTLLLGGGTADYKTPSAPLTFLRYESWYR